MAKKTITLVELTDDLDGSKADRTVAFSVDGTTYEIDLSKKNAAAFTKALKPYVDVARTVRGTRGRRASASRGRSRNDLADIRAWANGNGHQVSDRGRIPAAIIAAYDAR